MSCSAMDAQQYVQDVCNAGSMGDGIPLPLRTPHTRPRAPHLPSTFPLARSLLVTSINPPVDGPSVDYIGLLGSVVLLHVHITRFDYVLCTCKDLKSFHFRHDLTLPPSPFWAFVCLLCVPAGGAARRRARRRVESGRPGASSLGRRAG